MKKLNFQSVDWGTDCKSAPAGISELKKMSLLQEKPIF